jgi:hypothetical protein
MIIIGVTRPGRINLESQAMTVSLLEELRSAGISMPVWHFHASGLRGSEFFKFWMPVDTGPAALRTPKATPPIPRTLGGTQLQIWI